MTTLDQESKGTTSVDQGSTDIQIRTLRVWVASLVVLVLGLGAWLIYDLAVPSQTAVSGEIQNLLDDYNAAANAADGEAFLALVTDDYFFESPDGRISATQQASLITYQYSAYDFTVEQRGEPIMMGDGPWFVATPNHVEAVGWPDEGIDGISTFEIVDVGGGTLKVASHIFSGDLP